MFVQRAILHRPSFLFRPFFQGTAGLLLLCWLSSCGPGGNSSSNTLRSAVDSLVARDYAQSQSKFLNARLSLELPEEQARATYGIGRALLGLRRPREAAEEFQALLGTPGIPIRLQLNARARLGQALFHAGDPQQAQETLQGVLRQMRQLSNTERLTFQEPDRLLDSLPELETGMGFVLGQIAHQQKDYVGATRYLSSIVNRLGQADRASAFLILAEGQLEQGQPDRALVSLNRAYVATQSQDKEQRCGILSLQARLHRESNALMEAVETLTQAERICEDRQAVREANRQILEELPPENLRTILYRTPGESPADLATFYLARAIASQGELRDAIDLLRQLQADFPRSPLVPAVEEELKQMEMRLVVDPRTLGFVGPLSGRFAAVGKEILGGAELAVKLYNGLHPESPFQLLPLDSEGSAETACNAIRTLANDRRAIAIIGPVLTANYQSCIPVIQQLQIPTLTPSATGEGISGGSEYAFRTSLLLSQQAQRLVEFSFRDLGVRRFAILYPQSNYGLSSRTVFQEAITAVGGLLVAEGSYDVNATDFRNAILNVKRGEPDAVFLPGSSRTVGLLAPQLAFHEMGGVFLLGTNALNDEALVQIGGKHVEGLLFVDDFFADSEEPLTRSFIEQYRRSEGRMPSRLAAQSYDTARLLMLKLLELGVQANRALLMRSLREMTRFQSVTGLYSFDPDGDSVKRLRILGVREGRIVQVLAR